MAQTATIFRLKVSLSDVERSVYETLDLRLAQHPSETPRYLLTRALAYCLCYQEGIAFTRGLSAADEPAVWVKTPDGRTEVWIEIGNPSAERLHRASKACPRVLVFTHHDVDLLLRETQKAQIHRVETIEVYPIESGLLTSLEAHLERNMSWDVLRSDEQVYVTVSGKTFSAPLSKVALASS